MIQKGNLPNNAIEAVFEPLGGLGFPDSVASANLGLATLSGSDTGTGTSPDRRRRMVRILSNER